MDDHGRLFDSRVIVEYLDTLSPVSRLLPQHGRERAMTKCWEAIADGILDAAVAIRVEHTQRPLELRSEQWVNRQHGKITRALATMNDMLGDEPFCMGVNLSLADLAVGCALFYLDHRFPDIPWRAQHHNLLRLAEKLESRPSFASTTPPKA